MDAYVWQAQVFSQGSAPAETELTHVEKYLCFPTRHI